MTSAGAAFRTDELFLSQVPALQMLVNLGFAYLTPAEAAAARGGKTSNVLLEDILRDQLKKSNRIWHKGETFHFSEENIQSGIQKLKNIKYDGLLKTNEAVYDLLTLGVALEQSLEGSLKSFTLNYVDWRNPENNAYHVTVEFPVERTRSYQTCRADIVAFVNGIPFMVIECKSPREAIGRATAEIIRNQRDEHIPRLFTYAQLAIGINQNDARYGTVGTPARFWAEWKEEIDETQLAPLLEKPLPDSVKLSLFEIACQELGTRQDLAPYATDRRATRQDRALYALCRPERLLDLVWRFTVFDGGMRKIARYQQFFAVRKVLRTVKERDAEGRRRGGIVWHTQGSGKSLTMVMLARALALDLDIPSPRVLLVTDRVDLDKQLGNTFAACGLTPDRAESGRHLVDLVSDQKAHIITTLIHKFDKALTSRKLEDPSSEIFMLVDESHRTNFGAFAARMRQMFPRACYLGFTGTPLMSKEKNSFQLFGGLIDSYPIRQAVNDGAVVPLLYEGRQVGVTQDKHAVDTWFRHHTQGLSPAQKTDLKRKYSRSKSLGEPDRAIFLQALDISEHFRENWQGIAKAQLVAPSKKAALKYKEYLDEIGHISSEVIMSAPDEKEGLDETAGVPAAATAAAAEETVAKEITLFWQRMMKRYGNEEEYNKQIVNRFKFSDEPDMLIVVDKLITGFDAPRNTVLYLTRVLRGHTLLQAAARVNRLYDDEQHPGSKEFGYIVDYAGVLGELDKALTAYEALAGFEEEELRGTLTSISEESGRLHQAHETLWALFADVKGSHDEEAYEQLLIDPARRAEFRARLAAYGRSLGIALSSEGFIAATPELKLKAYKDDLRRFQSLRAAVKLRYQENTDPLDHEAKIAKLLNTHVNASEAIPLHEPANIFDEEAFAKIVEEQGRRKSISAQADLIAHATQRAALNCLEQDPAFYGKFSSLIQQTIDDFRARRISEADYLRRAGEIKDRVAKRRTDDLPASLKEHPDAAALFGVLAPMIAPHVTDGKADTGIAAQAALDIWNIFLGTRKVGYWSDIDAQRLTINAIDDYLYDVMKGKRGIALTTQEMDDIIRKSMDIARARMS